MPWEDKHAQREAFVEEARKPKANMSQLCHKYGISRPTGYKWLWRYQELGLAGLKEQSRRPHSSPNQTSTEVEDLIISLRQKHPAWGAVTLKAILEGRGHQHIPSASTITRILHRHGLISTEESAKRKAFQRFERDAPNELWQMDFKGEFLMTNGHYCYPLTVLDDHSRYLVGFRACGNEQWETVQRELTMVFREYGLPDAMLMDNGSPWGITAGGRFTILGVWLLRLGVYTIHGRKCHPQTQGKVERIHRTMEAELLSQHTFDSLATSQQGFDPWREQYNNIRPHQALSMAVPADRYKPSPRVFPEQLPAIDYGSADVRKVDAYGKLSYHNIRYHLGKGFRNQYVAFLPMETDGCFYVIYHTWKVAIINEKEHTCDSL